MYVDPCSDLKEEIYDLLLLYNSVANTDVYLFWLSWIISITFRNIFVSFQK